MSQHKLGTAEPTGYGPPTPLTLDPPSSTNRVLTREGKTLESWPTHDSGEYPLQSGEMWSLKKEKGEKRLFVLGLHLHWDT